MTALERRLADMRALGLLPVATLPVRPEGTIVLATRADIPHVLGVGILESDTEDVGGSTALDVDEVEALRDALNAWLDGHSARPMMGDA